MYNRNVKAMGSHLGQLANRAKLSLYAAHAKNNGYPVAAVYAHNGRGNGNHTSSFAVPRNPMKRFQF